MEKVLKFLDDVGAVGGVGAVLLLASWGLLVTDLIDFKPANLGNLTATQLVASLAGMIGLALVLYRLKEASKAEVRKRAADSADQVVWVRFASFLRDRRALVALQDYEHLPSMISSIDAVRSHLQQELQSLDGRSLLRADLERLQDAFRAFASTSDRIWEGREAVPSHIIEAVPYQQFQFCTAVGVLRGQIAAMLQAHDVPNTNALVARLIGAGPGVRCQPGAPPAAARPRRETQRSHPPRL